MKRITIDDWFVAKNDTVNCLKVGLSREGKKIKSTCPVDNKISIFTEPPLSNITCTKVTQ